MRRPNALDRMPKKKVQAVDFFCLEADEGAQSDGNSVSYPRMLARTNAGIFGVT